MVEILEEELGHMVGHSMSGPRGQSRLWAGTALILGL